MKLFLVFMCIGLLACLGQSNQNNAADEQLIQQAKRIDSLEKMMNQMLQHLPSDSIVSTPIEVDSIPHFKEEKKTPLMPSTAIEKQIEKQEVKQTEEPIENQKYYYKNSGKLSVEVIRASDRTEKFLLYDPFGNLKYEFEEHRSSYSVGVDIIEWHSNGAVAKVKVHTNPGASMYWYESVYTFGINNEPEWRMDTQFPQESVTMPGDNSYYWDKKDKSWKKQEVIYEQVVPRE